MVTGFKCFTPYAIFSGFVLFFRGFSYSTHFDGKQHYYDCVGKGSIDVDDGTFHDVLCVLSLSSNLLSIYQITHIGTGKTIEFEQDSVHIRDSEIGNIIAIGIIDHVSCLYSFSHFGPPSPLSETHSPSLRDSTEVKSGRLNLCVVPKTSVATSTPPSLVQISFVTQDPSSTLPDILAPFIEPLREFFEDISKDIHLLSDDRCNTHVISPPLEIPL